MSLLTGHALPARPDATVRSCALMTLHACAQVVWGWIIAALLAMLIGLSMAEISSGLPSAGGPFFWASCVHFHQQPSPQAQVPAALRR